jgi:uncharacterized protein (TIGR03083 family)
MKVTPRYDGPAIISMAGSASDQLVPAIRQRRRLEAFLGTLSPDEWLAQSRCSGWSVRDVVAHLAGVNRFWSISIKSGVAGRPTTYLANFDPVATPEAMVDATRDLEVTQLLAEFTSSNDEFIGAIDDLSDDEWELPAEAPPGHLAVRLVVSHALWDGWIHERDICLPLGVTPPREPDEVACSLRYVAALSAAFAVTSGSNARGHYGVTAFEPDLSFKLTVTDTVALRDQGLDESVPTLSGDALALLEALSYRTDFSEPIPSEWQKVLTGLASVFDVSP